MVLALVLGVYGCPSDPVVTDGGTGDGGPPTGDAATCIGADEDGDGIYDSYEGDDSVDTDGDGTPDYLDDDSDADGISDATEAGNASCSDDPRDSDADGTYDFRDTDSDDNGILDANEGETDTDGDGLGDFADNDNDGDGLTDATELAGTPDTPPDSDGDGTPDHLDEDSDNDTIADRHEGDFDTDSDGTPDRVDADSDGDGIPDANEAGDADLATVPVDTDSDTIPDFRDPDSDNDGLSDADELTGGTDPTDADSDDDGTSDLIEVSAGTDPNDMTDNPAASGDFVFLMPYMEAPSPPRDTLDFSTDIQFADVYFLMDTTGSMGSSITALSTAIRDNLIPGIIAEIPDTQFGLGEFRDYAVTPYGGATDQPFGHFQDITSDTAAAQAATSGYFPSGGYDGAESHGQAFYALATGNGLPFPGSSVGARTDCPADTFGYACFRNTAVPIVVMITDIYWHNGPGNANPYTTITGEPEYADVVMAATDNRMKMIGIGQGSGGMAHMQQFARDIGSVDMAGDPLVSTYSGGAAALTTTIVNQIRILASQTPLDISTVFTDDPADTVDTGAAFLERLEANEAGDPARGCEARMGEDIDMDGHPDVFRAVLPGNQVCFDVIVKQNVTVTPTAMPQLFRATVQVLGDGFTPLDERDVYFLVPPEITISGPS